MQPPDGMVQFPARGSRKLTVFARIDFAADAAAAGLALPPTRLLLFGNPRAGTPVIAAAPTAAVDLPLRVLIWAASDGSVMVGFNSPVFLAARHGVPDALRANLQPVEALAAIAAGTS